MATADAVLASRINYAQCWEDPRLLLAGLPHGPEDDLLSIASAGDNAIELALAGARSVTAIDLSAPQLALVELKLAGRHLRYEEYRQLLGLDAPGRRVFLYHRVREDLSDEARRFWDGREDIIREGILESGRFEGYLAAFRTRLLPLVHRRSTIEGWFDLPDLSAQERYYREHWDGLRWRALFRVFFSRRVMAALGRSPEQFTHVEGPVGRVFLKRAERAFCGIPVRDNPYLQWMLAGRWARPEATPTYLTREGHGRLGEAADRIRLVHGGLLDFVRQQPDGAFSGFNLSDLFEYLAPEDSDALIRELVRAARPGARLAYWNLLVDRHRPDDLADRVVRLRDEARALHAADRAFVYGDFQLEEVR